MLSEGQRLLAGAFQLDHSTSVKELGTLFVPLEDKPLSHLKQQLADAYGVAWSFPSTHGTTVLNILALLSACPHGGRVLVNRDAHMSVTAAMIHGDLRPTYLVPAYDADLGLPMGPQVAGVRAALDREPIDCIFLTSPNYFGVVGELKEIIELAHERDIPVVVDAAHAPHFHFCDALPPAAEDLGADLVTQSTHKVATALSQGSLLLINNTKLIEPLYEHVNGLGLVSTSFSYPILASIELGVQQLVDEGDAVWRTALDRARRFRDACGSLPGVSCFGAERVGAPGLCAVDTTRITLDVSHTGLTGFEIVDRLAKERIYPEMATVQHLVLFVTPGTSDADLLRLYASLARMFDGSDPTARATVPPPPPLPRMAAIPRAAKFASKQTVSLQDAVGRVSGETVTTYPPGSPIIAAGEVICLTTIEYLRCMKRNGAVLQGASDPSFLTIKVVS